MVRDMLKKIAFAEKKTVSLLILLAILAGGCSTKRSPEHLLSANHLPPRYNLTDNTYWWKCNFRIVWPDDSEIDWGMDLLLAHAVVSPVLVKHSNDILYWRFHRRAARDTAGHQFTFMFFSRPEIASVVLSEIADSTVLEDAYNANLIEIVLIDDPDHPQLPNVEDTSDRNWSPDLQKNWPSYIMGTSSLWLGLIDETMQDSPDDYTDIHLLLEKYRHANSKITETWRTEGQHALLHHLNAIFGYQPLHIRKALSF
jgi:hypothetical protein